MKNMIESHSSTQHKVTCSQYSRPYPVPRRTNDPSLRHYRGPRLKDRPLDRLRGSNEYLRADETCFGGSPPYGPKQGAKNLCGPIGVVSQQRERKGRAEKEKEERRRTKTHICPLKAFHAVRLATKTHSATSVPARTVARIFNAPESSSVPS